MASQVNGFLSRDPAMIEVATAHIIQALATIQIIILSIETKRRHARRP